MSKSLRQSILVGSIATLAAASLLAGCQKTTTDAQSSDGSTTTTTTTTTVAPSDAAASAGASMRATATDIGTEASQAMSKAAAETGKAMTKAGELVEDGMITAKVKAALLADADVKGLRIDVDTKDGVVTLKGTADKAANIDRAVRIAHDTRGVKSVDNQLVVKTSG